MEPVLEVRHLTVHFDTPSGTVQAVRDVSFSLHKGEVLAIVGESGCGKSVLCRSILKLLPDTARLPSGTILVNGVDKSGLKASTSATGPTAGPIGPCSNGSAN